MKRERRFTNPESISLRSRLHESISKRRGLSFRIQAQRKSSSTSQTTEKSHFLSLEKKPFKDKFTKICSIQLSKIKEQGKTNHLFLKSTLLKNVLIDGKIKNNEKVKPPKLIDNSNEVKIKSKILGKKISKVSQFLEGIKKGMLSDDCNKGDGEGIRIYEPQPNDLQTKTSSKRFTKTFQNFAFSTVEDIVTDSLRTTLKTVDLWGTRQRDICDQRCGFAFVKSALKRGLYKKVFGKNGMLEKEINKESNLQPLTALRENLDDLRVTSLSFLRSISSQSKQKGEYNKEKLGYMIK